MESKVKIYETAVRPIMKYTAEARQTALQMMRTGTTGKTTKALKRILDFVLR